jgi:hypothetical protein
VIAQLRYELAMKIRRQRFELENDRHEFPPNRRSPVLANPANLKQPRMLARHALPAVRE